MNVRKIWREEKAVERERHWDWFKLVEITRLGKLEHRKDGCGRYM